MGGHAAWDPLPLTAVRALLRPAPVRWWISGGLALELHLGQQWREHADTDVGVARPHVARFLDVLAGWDLQVSTGGQLVEWVGQPLSGERSENNVWCRRDPQSPWALDVTISDGDDHAYVFRRDRSITVPWDDAVLTSADGIPYLAPQLQLLFKSRDRRPKDDLDALTTIPQLDVARRAQLAAWLPRNHPWAPLTA